MFVFFMNLSVGLLLATMGAVVHLGKKYNLIAGYNTMSKEQKKTFDIKKFSRHFGFTFYAMGFALISNSFLHRWVYDDSGFWSKMYIAILISGVVYLFVFGEILKRKRR